MPYTVMLVDDQPEFLQLAQQLLSDTESVTIVAKARSGEEAVALLPTLKPDVVILDVNLPGMKGPETASRMLKSLPDTRIVMVSSIDDPVYRTLSKDVGAVGFLSKRRFSADAILKMLE